MGKFSSNIRNRREMLNLSQADLAKRAGVTQTTIWMYENGESTPKLAIAIALAKALGVTVEQLVGETQDTPA